MADTKAEIEFFEIAAPYLGLTRELRTQGASEEFLLKAIVCCLVLEAERAGMKLPDVLSFVDKAFKLAASVETPLLN